MNGAAPKSVVCQLVHGLPVGGTEVLVDRLVRRLASRFRIVIACLDEIGELGQRLIDDGVQVHSLHRRPGFDWSCVRRLARLLADERVQLVHAHQYTPFAYAAATRLLGRRPRIVFTEHGRFYPDYASRKRKVFNRLMTTRRDRLIAVGASVRQALIDNEGLSASQIQVIYNGVDLSPLAGASGRRAPMRQELGVTDDEFLVLQVARLNTIKDHATAIRALAAAIPSCPHMRLALVGDGPERQNIETQIAAHKLEKHVTMLGQRRDVADLLAAADAFLLTSVSEGIPVTIIEAMATGLPVVSTAVGGVPELISHGESGLVAPAGDDAQLAEALVRLASDAGLRSQLAECARRRAVTRFSEDQMVDQYARLYVDALDGLEASPATGRDVSASLPHAT